VKSRNSDSARLNPCSFRAAAIALIVIGTAGGCTLTVPNSSDSDSRTQTATEKPTAEDIWQALAQAVRNKSIDSTNRLAQYVTVLVRNGDLTEKDVALFDAVFPRTASEPRPLTERDLQVLLKLANGTR
jgi:hypothetical protein